MINELHTSPIKAAEFPGVAENQIGIKSKINNSFRDEYENLPMYRVWLY